MKEVTKLTASSLERLMNGCLGFLSFDTEKQPQRESAKEGDAFDEYFTATLKGLQIGDQSKNGYYFDEDMKWYTNLLLPHIPKEADTQIMGSWTTECGIPVVGRYDFAYVQVIDGVETLCVDDLKYGFGLVEVEKNWQLISYAINEIIRRQKAFSFIRLRIIQPRPHHPDGHIRQWVVSYDELIGYMNEINKIASEVKAGNRTLKTSKSCKFCPAFNKCEAANKAFNNVVDVIVEDRFVQTDLTEDEISRQLQLCERMVDLLKIKKESLEELAKSRITTGQVVPMYGLEESYGHRKWNPNVSAEAIKMISGIDISKVEMLSPAQAQRLGVPKELVNKFSSSQFKGMNLVRKDFTKKAEEVFKTIKKEG